MAELPYPPPPGLSAALGLAAAQHGVLGRDQALRSGLSAGRVGALVRARRWRILRPGVYYVRDGPPPLAARAKAAQLVYGPRAVVAGPTAARLWEMQGPVPGPGFEHIHLSVPGRGRGTATGVRLHGWDVPAGEVTLRHGIRLTTPGRTLRDTALLTDRHTAVSVLDSALQQGLVDPGDLPGLRDANAGRAGAPRSRGWWEECDGRAQSTFETRLRLVCADAGVAPETLQYPVHTADGGLAGHADLAWPSWGVVAEADGRGAHALPGALYADRSRQNRIAVAPERLVLLRFTWSDLRHPGQIAELVRAARDSAAPGGGQGRKGLGSPCQLT
ncbi:hypothetical protein J0910_25375 [Nocardiopsis sp. CNT-189]|uniref:hypothetical protein n=1 Tax=Nocardiopsis oceanisediminis TaxID=2816862 RepID=UPI003B37B5E1